MIPKPLAALLFLALSFDSHAAGGGFLFATFKGESTPMGEQIYFALSQNGRDWQALNQAEPVLVSEVGERGARDPFLIRSHDGSKTYLIATDLSINLNPDWGRAVTAGSHSILVWESDDLVNWSGPRLVAVAPKDAGCTWAPEVIYDEENGDYVVFWASTTARDDFSKHRIWACRTQDFRTFGEPFVYIEKEKSVIDTDIVRDGGRYYRFTKDESDKGMIMESSDTLAGDWQEMPESSLAALRGYEGPLCFQLEAGDADTPATWCLLLDRYSKGTGYHPFITNDLSSGQFAAAPDFDFPFHFRHGTVLPIDAEEFARLQSAFGEQP